MSVKGLPLSDSLALVLSPHPSPSPNPGFMTQLELWQDMGGALDTDHPGYKRFCMEQVGQGGGGGEGEGVLEEQTAGGGEG